MNFTRLVVFVLAVPFIFVSCSEETELTLFELLDAGETNIHFSNTLTDQEGLDVFRYRNYYNGAGVGIGDLNNNGFPDVYLVSNQGSNQLYFNQGDYTFENVTETSGTGGSKSWSSGVSLVDINGNGWLDIYVTNAGPGEPDERANELFINNGDGTFTERAAEFGLDDTGYSVHAVFFDFDQDGDLDCFILNNSPVPVSSLPLINTRDERDPHGGDKLLENQNGRFVDVSEEKGIFGSVIGFGLDITLLDVTNNGWTDIYISNDFFERDYLYINQQGEYFTEELEEYMDNVSHASMGADAGDLNNNGLPDVFTTEMLPEDMPRRKRMIQYEPYHFHQHKADQGFYDQFMRNALHLNNGNGTFSETGRYSNVHATDWSWAALIFDMDNDSNKEIFVTNGIYRDLIDQDFLEYFGSEENLQSAREGSEKDLKRFTDEMPSSPLPNYAFKADSLMVFSNQAERWGLADPSFSSGAAFGDLNNNGTRDLIINNVDGSIFVYRNHADSLTSNNYLGVELKGRDKNTFAIGARIVAYAGDKKLTEYQYPHRGFLSTSDYKIIFGLGDHSKADSLDVYWNASEMSRYYNLPADTTVVLSIEDARPVEMPANRLNPVFHKIDFNHRHRENDYNEFSHGNMNYHQLSREGPAVAAADLNGNGLDDFFIGGAMGSPGVIFINNGDGTFREVTIPALGEDRMAEDVDAVFFDANNNGLPDLYVVSGGNEYPQNTRRFADRLYMLDGFENGDPVFSRNSNLPQMNSSGCCVRPADFDGDGNMDLFIGSRSIPGEYGTAPSSYLLQNDGNGNFSDVTSRFIPQLNNLGMITDAVWADINASGRPDLIIVGDWMPIAIFENRGNFLQRKFNISGLDDSEGWWRSVHAADLTGDGNMDLIAGNLGSNSIFKATRENPVRLYMNDFERNGFQDHVYTYREGEHFYPYHNLHDLSEQLGFLRERFPTHREYSDKSINEIFTSEELSSSRILEAYLMESIVLINDGKGNFERKTLPYQAQLSPVYDILTDDFDRDGNPDLLLTGNFSNTKPEEGFYDANHGQLYKFDPDGEIYKTGYAESGLSLRGDVRNVVILNSGNKKYLVAGKNNDYVEIFEY